MGIELRSIREFCELDMPVWMFDKDGSFQVVRLEQVGCEESVTRCGCAADLVCGSFFRCRLAQSISRLLYKTKLDAYD